MRIPVHVPDKGRRAGHTREKKTQTPERLKSKERIHAARAEEEEDAKEQETEIAEQLNHGGNEEEKDPYLGERWPFNGWEDIAKGQDSPNKPELPHVPGETWLQQHSVLSALLLWKLPHSFDYEYVFLFIKLIINITMS
ncbi:hypothetical protein NDU88_005384 [Pleurodeles waltl]|uniref:Uncharacterized protein n=1 Tax=Pleurodeles waltl TaxID=8319 RepID=A0AAV7VKX6_PLEWA|nr:hypothetical protein NDU88_005384 [Pleurodeles waltl]